MLPPRILNRRLAASLCVAVLALCTPPCGTVKARAKAGSNSVGREGERKAAKTGPEAIKKVLELLSDLMVKIDRDATIDAKGFEEYNRWYQNISMNTKRVIDETSEQIDSLKAGLEEQEAFRDGAQRDLEEAGHKRGAVEKELTDTTERRKKERKEFEKTEATLAEGADQLERSLVVLGKEMAPQGAGSSASLLTVAEGLRKTLESGPDFDLSAGQRQTLHAFLRAANAKAHRSGDAADFLQVQQQRAGQPDVYGDYESQSGGVVSTLESVLEKTKAQLDEARHEETKAADTFAKYEADLKAEIKNLKRTMAELNTQLSQSQESSGQMQSQLIAATELLKVSQDQLKEIEAEFSEKNRNYKDRVAKRSDELMALTEAKEILSSEAMKQALDAAATAPEKAGDAATSAESFLQLSPRVPALCARGHKLARQAADLAARRWDQPAEEEAAPALSLVALRTRSRTREADPFEKVKDMISGMLGKLQDQQNEEAKHKEWCDREMSKSVQSQKEKQDNIRKLTDRIAAMDAELAQVTDGISVVTEDLAEMSASIKAATELRTDDHNAADMAITQSRDAQRLIKAAIKVLKRVYKDTEKEDASGATALISQQPMQQDAETQADEEKDKEKEASAPEGSGVGPTAGWGPGVIGILEVALQDYADLESEVSLQESVSNKEYKEMMDQSEIRQATFGKDLEYKGRAKVKLEGDRMRATTDLKGYQKELEAVETYLKELQSSCVARPSSYEERAARRESELKSLKEALDFLNGEGMA